MSPKEHRDRLFKNGKPLVRRLEILDGDQYSQDISILWAAYKSGSFSLSPELTQERFVSEIEEYFSKFNQVWIVDDRNSNFAKGRGQVGLVLTNVIDLIVEARFGFFTWATHRNILRAAASFLRMAQYSPGIGICLVRVSGENRVLPNHLRRYELLHYIGKSAKDEYLYSVRGRA